MWSWLSGPWAWRSSNPSRTTGAQKLVPYSDLVLLETSYGTDPVFSSLFLTHHHLTWAVPHTRILLLQFVPQGNFMDPCYLQTNMAFDEFPTKKKILNSGIIQNTRNLAPQEQWLTVLRLPYCLEEETWHEWIPETHPCLVAWSIMIQLHHFPCSCNFSLLRCGSEAGRTTQAPLFQHFSVVCWVAFSWQQHLARGSVGLSVDVCWGTVDSQLVLF